MYWKPATACALAKLNAIRSGTRMPGMMTFLLQVTSFSRSKGPNVKNLGQFLSSSLFLRQVRELPSDLNLLKWIYELDPEAQKRMTTLVFQNLFQRKVDQ